MSEATRDIDGLREQAPPESMGMDEHTAELVRWWERCDKENREMALYKRSVYGSADLDVMAAAMDKLLPPSPDGVSRRDLVNIAAIAFYVQGKAARIIGALAQGKPPSEDTWVDLEIYPRMARAMLEFGKW